MTDLELGAGARGPSSLAQQRRPRGPGRGPGVGVEDVLAVAREVLAGTRALVRAADPQRRVTPRSEVLCAGLAALAGRCHAALGGDPARAPAVHRAAGLLSLLTKVDDEVIDALDFHEGAGAPRDLVAARATAFLDVTLRALEEGAGVAVTARAWAADAACWCAAGGGLEGRRALARETGSALRELAGDGAEGRARLARLVALIRRGWAIQVDGVVAFSATPGLGPREAIDRVTAAISGAWLLMITRVGALPPDATRDVRDDEAAAFFVDLDDASASEGWGAWIQRADALCDLQKDVEGGFVQTWAGRLAWERDPRAWEALAARRDGDAAARLVRAQGVDLTCLPDPGALDALEARVADLCVGGLLRWIHAFLTWRWVVSPPARALPDPRLAVWNPPELDVPAYALAAERIARELAELASGVEGERSEQARGARPHPAPRSDHVASRVTVTHGLLASGVEEVACSAR